MARPEERNSYWKSALEVLAIVGPILCLIDCLIIPALLMVLPLVGIHQIYHGIGDQLLAFLVLAFCAPVLISGFLRHRRKRVLVMMSLGFSFIFFTNFIGQTIDQTIHTVIALIGSLLLIKANLDNRQLAKCVCHTEPVEVEEPDA